MIPSPARKISCRLTTTYAGFEGESELLEELFKRGLALPTVGPDLHASDGLLMYWTHQQIAPWQDEKWLAQSRQQLRPNQYLRMIENRLVSTESPFVEMKWFDQCVDPDSVCKSASIVNLFTLALMHGSNMTGRQSSRAPGTKSNKARLIWHRIYQPTPTEPLNFEATVEATIRELKSKFRIAKVCFDPWQMQSTAQRLRWAGIWIEEFTQSSPRLTEASQNLFELIKSRNIILYPDADIRMAISRAVAKETSRGWHIGKQRQTHKIDAVIALGMAALLAAREGGVVQEMASTAVYTGVAYADEPKSAMRKRIEAEMASNIPPCTLDLSEKTKNHWLNGPWIANSKRE